MRGRLENGQQIRVYGREDQKKDRRSKYMRGNNRKRTEGQSIWKGRLENGQRVTVYTREE